MNYMHHLGHQNERVAEGVCCIMKSECLFSIFLELRGQVGAFTLLSSGFSMTVMLGHSMKSYLCFGEFDQLTPSRANY